jgi:hypothetical protein
MGHQQAIWHPFSRGHIGVRLIGASCRRLVLDNHCQIRFESVESSPEGRMGPTIGSRGPAPDSLLARPSFQFRSPIDWNQDGMACSCYAPVTVHHHGRLSVYANDPFCLGPWLNGDVDNMDVGGRFSTSNSALKEIFFGEEGGRL